MELLLNLAWLLVTVICSVALLRRVLRTRNSVPLWVMITAVVCVMVLLFPVISMTDDLHAEVFTAEESGKRNVVAVQVQQLSAFAPVLAAWLLIFMPVPLVATRALRFGEPVPGTLDGNRVVSFIRPPPSLVLA